MLERTEYILTANGKTLDLSTPKIMGIVNVTPDSFSDHGAFYHFDAALKQVEKLLNEGADIIDIGGESTRPNAPLVSLEEELQRVVPLVEAVRKHFDCWISVDTSKPEVMQQAADVGMDMINDIRSLSEKGALQKAVELNLPTCLMHMQGEPQTMQQAPQYHNVVEEVSDYLTQQINRCLQAGMSPQHIVLDPGFGFGKTTQHNYQLLQQLERFTRLGCPILVGMSRKSMLGNVISRDVHERIYASVTTAVLAVERGAQILRVHDVAPTRDGLQIWQAMQQA